MTSLQVFDRHREFSHYRVMGQRMGKALKALANERRRRILIWLRDPTAHFPAQWAGDLVVQGVCGELITEKLGVSRPTASEHLRVLAEAGFLTTTRIRTWTFYRRDEEQIAAFKTRLDGEI